MKKAINKICSGILFVTSLFCLGDKVFALPRDNLNTSDNYVVDITIPSNLKLVVDEEGVYQKPDFTITNSSLLPITLYNVGLKTTNDWKIVPKEQKPFIRDNTKEFAVSLDGVQLKEGDNSFSQVVEHESSKDFNFDLVLGNWTQGINEKAFDLSFDYEINKREFSLVFDSNGGSSNIEPVLALNGDEVRIPNTIVEKVGYTFDGWESSKGIVYQPNDLVVMPVGGETLTARWKANEDTKYVVNHYQMNLDGSTYSLFETEDKTGTTDSVLTTSDLSKTYTGFTYSNSKVDNGIVTSTTIKSDGSRVVDLYYSRNKYYIDINGVIDGRWNSNLINASTYAVVTLKINDKVVVSNWIDYFDTAYYGSKYEFIVNVKDGREFIGLYEKGYEHSTYGWFAPVTSLTGTIGDSNLAFAPKINTIQYSISYNLNGGTNPSLIPTTYNVDSESVVLPIPSKEGYVFEGWFDNPSFTGTPVLAIPKGSTGNKDFYARWELGDVTLLDGPTFNSTVAPLVANAKSLEFTTNGIPSDKISNAVLVSSNGSTLKAYAYLGGENNDVVFVSPKIDGGKIYAPENCYNMLKFSSLEEIVLSNFDSSNVTSMKGMFSNCFKLKRIVGLELLNTSKVTDMSWMFQICSVLESVDLSKFNTSNVTNMENMFDNCDALVNVILKGLDLSNVKSMQNMFIYCDNLEVISFEGVSLKSVTSMRSIFEDCIKLSSVVGLKDTNTASLTSTSRMFYNCKLLKLLDLTNFNTSNVTNMSYMFYNCNSLKSIPGLNTFNTSKVTSMSYMFSGCSSLLSLDVSNFNTVNVTTMEGMFKSCNSLTSLNVNLFNTSNVKSFKAMFYFCAKLVNIDLSNFDTSNVEDMFDMFSECHLLETVKGLENFNTSKVTNMGYMFRQCWNLKELNISFNMKSVKDMTQMFYGDRNLSGSIVISCPNGVSYSSIFNGTSTSSDSKFIVKYSSDETKALAQSMVNTKSSNSNVYLFEDYSITYNLNGGTNPSTGVVTSYNIETSTFSLPTPSRVGYKFSGWFDNSSFTGKSITEIVTGSVGNKTFYAKWTPITYTIKFDGNGATSGSMGDLLCTYGVNNKLTFNAFTKTGYTFLYWNTKKVINGETYWLYQSPNDITWFKDGEQPSGYFKHVYSDGAISIGPTNIDGDVITLVAQWKPNTYTLTLDENYYEDNLINMYGKWATIKMSSDYSVTEISDSSTVEERSLELKVGTPTSTGYFGFYTSVGGRLAEGETYTWSINIKASKEGVVRSIGHEQDSSYGGRNILIDNTWKTYSGIFKASSHAYTGFVIYFYDTDFSTGDKIYISDLKLTKGTPTNTSSSSKEYGSNYGTLPTPSRTGYTFKGWYDKPIGGNQVTSATTMGAGDTTIYAQWTPNTDTKYIVNHYQMDLDGTNYTLKETESKTGTSDSGITISSLAKTYTGFTYSNSKVGGNVVTNTTISADGSRVVDLYYSRNKYYLDVNGYIDGVVQGSLNDSNGINFGKFDLYVNNSIYKSNVDDFCWELYYGSSWELKNLVLSPGRKYNGLFNQNGDSATSLVGTVLAKRNTVCLSISTIQYPITYNLNGGTNPNDAKTSYTVDDLVVLPTPTRAGYTFGGWYEGSNFTGQAVTTIPKGSTGDKIYYAKWNINKLYIQYHVNGGSLADKHDSTITSSDNGLLYCNNSPIFHTVNYNDSLPSSGLANWNNSNWINLVRVGYSLSDYSAWNTKPDGSGVSYDQYTVYKASDFADLSNGDVTLTLYANWKPNKDTPYKINHYQMDLDGVNYTLVDTDIETGASDGIIKEDILFNHYVGKTYEGFTYSHMEVDGVKVSETTNSADGSRVIDFYYTRNKYRLDVGGWVDGIQKGNVSDYGVFDITINGTKYMGLTDYNELLYYGSTFHIDNIKINVGYEGKGFYVGPISSTLYTISGSNGTLTKESYVDLWINTIKYSISYNLDGGTNPINAPLSYTVDSAITLPTPTKENYKFLGWKDSSTGYSVSSIPKGTTGNKSYTAQWALMTHEVAYDLQGGSIAEVDNSEGYKIIPNGTYYIQSNFARHMYIHVYYANRGIGARTCICDSYGGPQTRWTFERYKNTPYYYIQSEFSGNILELSGDFTGGGVSSNSTVQLWHPMKGDVDIDALWCIIDNGDGSVKIKNKATGNVIEIIGGSTQLDTVLCQATSSDKGYQNWNLVAAKLSDYPNKIKEYSSSLYINSSIPVKQGYVFKGWNTKPDGTGVSYQPEDSYNMDKNGGTVTLYAQWESTKIVVQEESLEVKEGTSNDSKDISLEKDDTESSTVPLDEEEKVTEETCVGLDSEENIFIENKQNNESVPIESSHLGIE